MPQWQIDSVRLSVFVPPDFVAPQALWVECVGEEPETSGFIKASNTKVQTGVLAEEKLTLQIQPMRIDWIHEAASGYPVPGPEHMGPFPDATDALLQLVRRWAISDAFPNISRVALGILLTSETTDRLSGYRELSDFIDGVPNSEQASDFLYQVNIRRPSKTGIEGLILNRLSRWSVALYRTFALTPPMKQPMVSQDLVALRLELDINTNPDFQGAIPRERFSDVLDDLLDGAKEIYEQGAHVK